MGQGSEMEQGDAVKPDAIETLLESPLLPQSSQRASATEYQTEHDKYHVREKEFEMSDKYIEQTNYWVSHLTPLPDPLVLPLVRTKSKEPGRHVKNNTDTVQFILDVEHSSKIKKISAEFRSKPENALFSIYLILLNKLSQQNDICVAVPTDLRSGDMYTDTTGNESQTLPLRISMRANSSFSDLLFYVNNTHSTAWRNSGVPLIKMLVELEGDGAQIKHRLFGTKFSYQKYHQENSGNQMGMNPRSMRSMYSMHDLTLEVVDACGELRCTFIYNTDKYEVDSVTRWVNYFHNITATTSANPTVKIGEIPLLSDQEITRQVVGFNRTKSHFNLDRNIGEWFDKAANNHSDATAIITQNSSLSYAELHNAVNKLAAVLIEKQAGPGKCVGILLGRDEQLIISMLAVLKTGAAYVPLDPEYPAERLSYMLESSRSQLLVGAQHLCHDIEFDGLILDPYSVSVEDASGLCLPINSETILPLVKPTDVAYVIYTSGSTGNPKGVMVEHRNVINFVESMIERLDLPEKAVVLGLTTVSFDIFVLEVFLSLLTGNKLVLASEIEQKDPNALLEKVQHSGVNVIQMTPSRLQLLIAGGVDLARFFEGVDSLLLGGEAFPQQHMPVLKAISGLRIHNMYGPTETTVWSTTCELTERDSVSMGTPIGNTRVYILSEQLAVLPIGTTGQLYIAGEGLARGYINDDLKTRKVFVCDPFYPGELMYNTGDLAAWTDQGELEYHGRNDNQIKHRGYRIELLEIEKALTSLEPILAAGVVVQKPSEDMINLVAYCTSASHLDDLAFAKQVKQQLAATLPVYMIPDIVLRIADMPLTPNGKVDRKRLPEQSLSTGRRSSSGDTSGLASTKRESKLISMGIEPDFINECQKRQPGAYFTFKLTDAECAGILEAEKRLSTDSLSLVAGVTALALKQYMKLSLVNINVQRNVHIHPISLDFIALNRFEEVLENMALQQNSIHTISEYELVPQESFEKNEVTVLVQSIDQTETSEQTLTAKNADITFTFISRTPCIVVDFNQKRLITEQVAELSNEFIKLIRTIVLT